MRVDLQDFTGERPRRAAWFVRCGMGSYFGIEVRPAREESRHKTHDRYAPGLHHMALHAESPEDVDRIHAVMQASGAIVLDPPAAGRRSMRAWSASTTRAAPRSAPAAPA